MSNGTSAAGNVTSSNASTPPLEFATLFTTNASMSGVADWLKLLIIGGLAELCRRLYNTLRTWFVMSFYVTAEFKEDDSAYEWMMLWLAQQPSWGKARSVQVSTQDFGVQSPALIVPGDTIDDSDYSGGRRVAYLPSTASSSSFWFKRRYVTVARVSSTTGWYGKSEESLWISILTRDRTFLDKLVLGAKRDYLEAAQQSINIYVSDTSNNWRWVAARSKRPMRSIVLDPGIKDLLLDDAKDFLASKHWYAERGIPFRRGYLLYGAPGSGKTSMIHALAGELGLHVYIITLSRAGLDDTALASLISDLPEKCIALMEDIDAAFTHGLSRGMDEASKDKNKPGDGNDDASKSQSTTPPPSPQPPTGSRVSLSGLLNALDGVGAQEGRILFATTNNYAALDPALIRAGRMDIHLEFKLASSDMAREMFRRFYLPDDEDLVQNDVREGEVAEKEEGNQVKSTDSGYGSHQGSPELPLIDLDSSSLPAETLEKPSEPSLPTPPDNEPRLSEPSGSLESTSSPHRRPPKFPPAQIECWATQFCSIIPDRELSMAALQGYLMTYKTRPETAVGDAAAWVVKEKERKGKGENERKAKAKKEQEEKAKRELAEKEKEAKDKAKKVTAIAVVPGASIPTVGTSSVADVGVTLLPPGKSDACIQAVNIWA